MASKPQRLFVEQRLETFGEIELDQAQAHYLITVLRCKAGEEVLLFNGVALTGTVVGTNDAVVDDPSLVNTDPYGEGWLFKVDVREPGELISAEEYRALTEA